MKIKMLQDLYDGKRKINKQNLIDVLKQYCFEVENFYTEWKKIHD